MDTDTLLNEVHTDGLPVHVSAHSVSTITVYQALNYAKYASEDSSLAGNDAVSVASKRQICTASHHRRLVVFTRTAAAASNAQPYVFQQHVSTG
jgi:hypothetical protein